MNELALESKPSEEVVRWNRENGYPDLSPQERAFARKYMESFNVRTAARDVGLPVSKAHLTLKKPLVGAFIEDLEAQYSERSFLSRELVILEQVELLDKLMGREEVPIVTVKGDKVVAKKFHAMEAVKLLGDLAKQTGASKSSGGEGSAVTVNIDFSALGVSKGGSEKDVTPVEVSKAGITIDI